MRLLLILLGVVSLAACATTEDSVLVAYAAPPTSPTAGASQVNVTVTAADARTANRGRISTKLNGYGMEMAAIRSKEDVSDTVRKALESELRARGYGLAGGGPRISAAVDTFYAQFSTGVLAGKAKGDVQLTVTVAGKTGAERYRTVVKGSGIKTIQMASGSNAAVVISQALADALSQLFSDPAFVRTLS